MPAMNPVTPIGQQQQQQVIAEVNRYITWGGEHFGRSFPAVPVLFDLKGTTCGMYKLWRDRCAIRFNPWIFARYYDDSLATTVPHEVAHYLTDMVYGLRNIRPHGVEWKRLMAVFGADDSVRSSYSLEGIPRRAMRRHSYRCACRVHQLSAHRHGRVLRGQSQYRCRTCGDLLCPAEAP